MQIMWWGHACFAIRGRGVTVLTDPYDRSVGYRPVDTEADLVTVSHQHFDHNAVELLPGEPEVISTTGDWQRGDLKITGLPSYHDREEGAARGKNTIFVFELEGRRVCHLGDLGHQLKGKLLADLQGVEILLIPVGGTYTVDAREAYQICRELQPAVIIPMHYQTEVLDLPISGVDEFLKHFAPTEIKRTGCTEIEISELPQERTVYVLDYAGK